MKFYLGTHRANWLWDKGPDCPPLFVARQQFEGRRLDRVPRASTAWALDSGGFTELSKHGRWTWNTPDYADLVGEVAEAVGGLAWVAPQDWMCEPHIVALTGLSVREHQQRTVDNGLELRRLAPELPFVLVVQGYTVDEYLRCIDLYRAAGVDLRDEPFVGIGSVCRRENTDQIEAVFRELADAGLRMHGFGVKGGGFRRYAQYLHSADSLAWSSRARWEGKPQPGCEWRGHKNCANCYRFARRWYGERLAELKLHAREEAA